MITVEKIRQKIGLLSSNIEELTKTREEYLSHVHNIEMEITRLVGAITALDSLIKENDNEIEVNDSSELCSDSTKIAKQSNSCEGGV
jgi:chromosome segregation ATPase